jgi:hypothetical protein
VLRQLAARAVQQFHVLLGEVGVMRGDLHQKRLLLLRRAGGRSPSASHSAPGSGVAEAPNGKTDKRKPTMRRIVPVRIPVKGLPERTTRVQGRVGWAQVERKGECVCDG